MQTNKKSLTESYRILYFGDSHSVMTMGKTLLESFPSLFNDFENQAYFYAVSGATFRDWLTGDVQKLKIKNSSKLPGSSYKEGAEPIDKSLFATVREVQPDVLILALGTNDLLQENIDFLEYLSLVKYNLEKLFLEQPSLQVIWIMPPELNPEVCGNQSRAKLLEMLRGLKFVEVVNVEKILPDQKDQIHFHISQAKLFAAEILKQLEAIFPHH